jgi:hypothetical protein
MRDCPIKPTVVISGRALGVDRLGEEWAKKNNIPIEWYPANWDRDGKAAGPLRNVRMAEKADALIAVWDGESRGTAHMISTARKLKLIIYICKI